MNSATLELSKDEMREMGYRTVDMLVDYWAELANRNAVDPIDIDLLLRVRNEPIPESPENWRNVLSSAEHNIFGIMGHMAHPRFLAFVPSPSNFASCMADALVSGFNVPASLWRESPGAAECERTTLRWIRELIGLDNFGDGLFTSGGSVANLIGLAAARNHQLEEPTSKAVAYCSAQTHSCVARAMRVLGFHGDQLQPIPVDSSYRMSIPDLTDAIRADRNRGRLPFCIIANAGTTNTGSVDDLHAVADICECEGMWNHVDGAYGAAAALTPEGRRLLSGMNRANSVVVDPHKWLFQPYEAGVCLVREPGVLQQTFSEHPEYLQDVVETDDEVNFSDRGVQLSRHLRAFKLWFSLKVFGAQAFRDAVQRGIDTANSAADILRDSGRFEILSGPSLGVVTFRLLPGIRQCSDLDNWHRLTVDHLLEDGYAFVTSTELDGRRCLRFCTINPRITRSDLVGTVERIIRIADAVACDADEFS